MQSLLGQVALVTGAAQGIGFGIASVLAESGAEVYLLDRNAEGVAAAAESLRAGGAEATAIPADVTSQADVTGAAADIISSSGRLDVCVSNAGLLGPRVLVAELGTDEFRRMIYAVRYLAAPEASYVTGQSLAVDGGATLPEGLPEPRREREH
jgi:NAD(P)-dependent dehydrogenase (short-subunit alcohol dehydrogenase family)